MSSETMMTRNRTATDSPLATTMTMAGSALVFRLPRSEVEVKVHARVNVRVLQLIDTASGSRIELEGNRIPLTHSKDVIHNLIG